MAQPVDLVVDGAVLFNVGIRGRDVGLRLIIVVIGYEILHRIFRKKLPELGAQLRGQGFVVRQHQGGPVDLCDHVRHGEGLAAARHPQKGLGFIPPQNALCQLFNGLRLVARGLIGGYKLKMIHLFSL